MTKIRVSTVIDATADEVWDDIRHIDRHVEWMADAKEIRITSDFAEGPGVRFECDTNIGPFHMTDHMEVTGWTDQRSMAVRHVGIVTGEGEFVITPIGDDAVEFAWSETLSFPWWMGGPVGALFGGIVFRVVWMRNLRALRKRFA